VKVLKLRRVSEGKVAKVKKQEIRITRELEIIPINKLTLWDDNPRINDPAAIKLANLIKEYGFVTPVTIDQNNIVRKGNTGIKAARILGMKEVPAVRVPYKEGKAKTYGLADNKAGEWASWDEELLYTIMQQKDVIDFTKSRERLASVTGFSQDEIRGLHFEPDLDKLENIEATDQGLMAIIKIKCEPVDKDMVLDIIAGLKNELFNRGISAEVL